MDNLFGDDLLRLFPVPEYFIQADLSVSCKANETWRAGFSNVFTRAGELVHILVVLLAGDIISMKDDEKPRDMFELAG